MHIQRTSSAVASTQNEEKTFISLSLNYHLLLYLTPDGSTHPHPLHPSSLLRLYTWPRYIAIAVGEVMEKLLLLFLLDR